MKLPFLNDLEIQEVYSRSSLAGIDPDVCPTCGTKKDEDNQYVGGTYRFLGETRECDCANQVMLRKHYLLANIPDQYMKLDWKRDFYGSETAREAVEMYLSKWPGFKAQGMGMEFASTGLGVGKTFAATTIGKELIRRREKVFFLPFNQMLSAMREDNRPVLTKLDTINVVILDEIQPPPNEKLANIMADRFESIVRNRTNYNGVTIMTTNMNEVQWEEHYGRVYSLLSAKQVRIEMTGVDARKDIISQANLDLILNDEVRPIS